jgi:hypothetical protein
MEREMAAVVDDGLYPDFASPRGYHGNFSPDGTLIAIPNPASAPGMLAVYPANRASSPVWLARFMINPPSPEEAAYPTWSPDSTKVVFWGHNVVVSGAVDYGSANDDVYVAIFQAPAAPTEVRAMQAGNGLVDVTWKPASQHREIKEYQIHRASSQNGVYAQVGTLAALYTHLEAPSRLNSSSTTLSVDSTAGFPGQGVIEVFGLSPEYETELVSYTGTTPTSFTGCTRGAYGTTAAEHWNDAVVWSHTGAHGYTEALIPGACYKVRAEEWSGLQSDFSLVACTNGDDVSPSPPQGLTVVHP